MLRKHKLKTAVVLIVLVGLGIGGFRMYRYLFIEVSYPWWGTIPAWDSVAPPNTNQQTPVSADIPSLDYCDLANDPDKYDGQTIRVTATLYFMMHGYKFLDRACLADEKETAVLLNGEHEAKLAKDMGMEEYHPWNFPMIVATGKFNRVTPNRKSDTVADNSNLIFEMETVERVIKFPNE